MLKKLINAIHQLSQGFLFLASLFCLALVLLTCEQVVARYFFEASSVGLQELQWHFFGAIFLLAAAATFRDDEHVRVDIFYSRLPRRGQSAINVVGILLAVFPMCYFLITYGLDFVEQALSYANPRPSDYYSAELFNKEGMLYQISHAAEAWIRETFLNGEISPDPGGLEGRMWVKALIPVCGLLLLIQSFALLLSNGYFLIIGKALDDG